MFAASSKRNLAEPLFRQAITTLQTNLGANSPHIGEAQMSLAVFYYAWDKPDPAEPYFEKRLGNLMAQFRANASTMSEKNRLIFLATTPGAFPLFYILWSGNWFANPQQIFPISGRADD